jgi:molybdate transport system regulatory protein
VRARLALRIKLEHGHLGRGKVELLEHIAETGSLAAAARAMQMSYKRAWELLAETNRLFAEPVALSHPGRNVEGATSLTPFGLRVIALYRAIERRATQSTAAAMAELTAAAPIRRTARRSSKPTPPKRKAA